LGLSAALEYIGSRLKGLDSKSPPFAYLDAVVVVVAPGQAEEAHRVVEATLASHGLALNAGKTCVWSRDPQAPLPEVLQGRRKPELRLLGADVRFLDRHDDRDVFGAPVWGSVAGGPLVESAKKLVKQLSAMQDAGLRGKTAYTVLHTYAQGCCNHLLRANYEEGGWVEDLEEVLQEGLARVTGSPLDAGQRALASLRLKDGGIAFGGFRGRSAPAFLGSWGMVFQEVASGIGVATLEGFSSRCPTVWAEIGRAEQSLRVLGGNGGRALDWGQMIDEPAGKLQGTWAKEISENRREAILWSLPERDAADARPHGGPSAGSFLCPPCLGGKVMRDQHFTVSLRDRLLLPVCQEGARCQHRRPNGSLCNAPLDARGKHAKTCAIGGGLVRRHNGLRDYGSVSWKACTGVQALTEQRVP